VDKSGPIFDNNETGATGMFKATAAIVTGGTGRITSGTRCREQSAPSRHRIATTLPRYGSTLRKPLRTISTRVSSQITSGKSEILLQGDYQ
jgi:hypothetical protein